MNSMKLIAALAAVAVAAPALAALGTSVNGQGALDPQRTFAVSARVNADGTATGTATLINRAFSGDSGRGPYQAHFDITCGKMLDNKTMLIGGYANRTNDSNLKDSGFFIVRDEGEPGAGRDQISRVAFFDDDPNTVDPNPMRCLLTTPADLPPLETIQRGNLQVQVSM